jgi:hypothetical protein
MWVGFVKRLLRWLWVWWWAWSAVGWLSSGVAGWPDEEGRSAARRGDRWSGWYALVSELVSQAPNSAPVSAGMTVTYGAGLLSQVNGRVAGSCANHRKRYFVKWLVGGFLMGVVCRVLPGIR